MPNQGIKFYQQTWFTVLMLIFLFPIGVLVMWIQGKFSSKARVIITIVGGLLFIGFMNSNNTDTDLASAPPQTQNTNSALIKQTSAPVSTTTPNAPQQPVVKPKPKNDPEHQRLVKEFEQTITGLEKSIDPIMKQYQDTMSSVGNGSTIYDAYTAAKYAREAVKNVKGKLYTLSVPNELPGDVRKKLEEVKEEFGTAYFCKEEALKYAMKFLDEQKPSDMDKFKEEINAADSFMISAAAKLLEAETMVGIDFTKSAK